MPSVEEEGEQPLQSPMRDAHLSWGGGVSSPPSASSLPACPQGLSVDVLLAPAGSSANPNPLYQVAPGRVLPQDVPLGLYVRGLGTVVVTTLTLLSPGPPRRSLGMDHERWGFMFWGCRGKPRAGRGRFHPCPPLPAALSWWWREKGAEGWDVPVQGVLGQGWRWARPLLPLSLCCIKLIPWRCPDKSFQSL